MFRKKLIQYNENPSNTSIQHIFQIYRQICDLTCRGKLNELKSILDSIENIDCSRFDYSPLHYAVLQPNIITYLTDPEMQIYKKFGDQMSEVHAAAFSGSQEIFNIITANPSQLHSKTTRGEGIFYWAAAGNQYLLLNVLTLMVSPEKNDETMRDVAAGTEYFADMLMQADEHLAAHDYYKKAMKFLYTIQNKNDSDKIDLENCQIKFFRAEILIFLKTIILEHNDVLDCHDEKYIDQLLKQEMIRQPNDTILDACIHNFKLFSLNLRLQNVLVALEHLDNVLAIYISLDTEFYRQKYILKELFAVKKRILKESTVNMAAEKWGFKPLNVPADGNCFFHAICHQLKLYPRLFPSKPTHEELRRIAVEHLHLNFETYKSSYPNDEKSSLTREDQVKQKITTMAKLGTWADHQTIQALVNELRVGLAVIFNDEEEPLILKTYNSIVNLYIIYENRVHFQSTIVYDPEAVIALQQKIQNKEVDDIYKFVNSSNIAKYHSNYAFNQIDLYDTEDTDDDNDNDSPLIKKPKVTNVFEADASKLICLLTDPNVKVAEVKELIDKYNIDINQTYRNYKPIYVAARNSSLEVFQFLVEECNADLSIHDDVNLFYPALNRPEILYYLANTVDKRYLKFKNEITDIQAAVVCGDQIGVLFILDSKPNLINASTTSIFYWSALVGHFGLIEALRSHFSFSYLRKEEQYSVFDYACTGAEERAKALDDRNELKEAIISYEFAIRYIKKAVEFDSSSFDEGNDRLQDILEEIFTILECYVTRLIDNDELDEAITTQRKYIRYYHEFDEADIDKQEEIQHKLTDLLQQLEKSKQNEAKKIQLRLSRNLFPPEPGDQKVNQKHSVKHVDKKQRITI